MFSKFLIAIIILLILGISFPIFPKTIRIPKILIEPLFNEIIEYKSVSDINYFLCNYTPLVFFGDQTKKQVRSTLNNLFVIHYIQRIELFGRIEQKGFESYQMWYNLFIARVEARKKANGGKDDDFEILADESWFLLNRLKEILREILQ